MSLFRGMQFHQFPLGGLSSRLTLTSSPGWDFVETRANPTFFSRRLDQTLLVKSPILFPSNMMSYQTNWSYGFFPLHDQSQLMSARAFSMDFLQGFNSDYLIGKIRSMYFPSGLQRDWFVHRYLPRRAIRFRFVLRGSIPGPIPQVCRPP